MDRQQLKKKIEQIQSLPVSLPVLGAIAERFVQRAAQTAWALPYIEADPVIVALLFRVIGYPQPLTAPETGEALIKAVGETRLQHVVLAHALEAVGKPNPEYAAAANILWRRALASAYLAEHLARLANTVPPAAAYLAGLLQDLGRFALLTASPEAYVPLLQSAKGDTVPSREEEQRVLGVDHTQAGKWLAEQWGLPRTLIDCIWLHHHPLHRLNVDHFPMPMLAVLHTADTLSPTLLGFQTTQGNARPGQFPIELSAQQIDTVLESARKDYEARLQSLPGDDSAHAILSSALHRMAQADTDSARQQESELHSLRKQARLTKALSEMQRLLSPGLPQSRVGETIVKAIQQGLEIAPALCCIVGADDNCLYVHSWQSLDMQPEMSVFNLDEPAAGGGESELSLVSCLKDLGLWRSDTGPNVSAFDAIVRRDGLLVLPFAAQGATYGHLVFGAEISGARDIDHDLAQYIEFTAGCAQALARWRDEKQHRIRYESLVDDLSASVSSQEATDWRDLTHIALQAIQNTLSKGMAHAEWLRARVQDGQARRAGDALLQHNQEAAAIVRDLGMLLRPEPPRKEPSLANYAIHRAVLTAQERLQGQGIALAERYEEGLPRIAVDRRQMEQVLVSILNNAEDALASRGGRIEIATAAAPDRKGVIVSIADNGPGIQGESMELAFEPFFTTRGDRGRLGLGLTVCRTIMENHGGSIALRRAHEGGTVVELIFPSASGVSSDRTVVDLDAVRNSFDRHAGTVLLIGGQAPLRQMLLDRGFVVESSPAGPEAIEALLRRPVDITIVDLPDLNPEHASFVSQVRYHRPSVPVIVMTAAGQSEGASELLRRGVRACLTKPVDGNVLLAEIEGLNITGRG